jgi:hypothetical protein
MIDMARDRGAVAVTTWGKTLTINIIRPAGDKDKGVWLNDHHDLVSAALEASDDAEHGYLVTVTVGPDGVDLLHLVGLGEYLASTLPPLPGDAA